MKNYTRILLIVPAMVLAVMIVCSCAQEGGKLKYDTVRVKPRVDIPEDTVSEDTMPTPDMILVDVTGPVAEIQWEHTFGEWANDGVEIGNNKPYMSYTWTFDDHGNLSTITGRNNDDGEISLCNIKIYKRNDDGYATTLMYDYTDSNKQSLYNKAEQLEWNNGVVTKRTYTEDDYSEQHRFEFDSGGHYKRHEMLMREGNEGYKTVDAYKYTEFDEHGNWTERYVRTIDMSVYYDESGNPSGYGDSGKYFTLERRRITYRPIPEKKAAN